MSKNEQLAEQSLAAQQGFFGKLTDAEQVEPVEIAPGVKVMPMPACLQLHTPPGPATSSVGTREFDTQGPYGKHVYGLPVVPTTTMSGDSKNAGEAGENPKEEITKLRGQFRELITDNAAGTYKLGSNGQLIADEVCVEGLIDDLEYDRPGCVTKGLYV